MANPTENITAYARESQEPEYVTRSEFKRSVRNRWIAYVILLVGLIVGFSLNQDANSASRDAIVTSGKVVAVTSCNESFKDKQNIRVIVKRSLASLKEYRDNPGASPLPQDLIKRGIEQNEKALAELVLPDCRDRASLITDDPRDTVYPPPNPLYPGAPETQELP